MPDPLRELSSSAGAPGVYGKMPAHGDFIRRGLPASFVTPWDQWMAAGIEAARARLGDRFPAVWDAAPAWRFALPAGVCGAEAVAGVMLPSQDGVGRRFPLTAALLLSAGGDCDDGWYGAVEALLRAARDGAMDADALAEALGAPPAAAPAAPDALLSLLGAGAMEGGDAAPDRWTATDGQAAPEMRPGPDSAEPAASGSWAASLLPAPRPSGTTDDADGGAVWATLLGNDRNADPHPEETPLARGEGGGVWDALLGPSEPATPGEALLEDSRPDDRPDAVLHAPEHGAGDALLPQDGATLSGPDIMEPPRMLAPDHDVPPDATCGMSGPLPDAGEQAATLCDAPDSILSTTGGDATLPVLSPLAVLEPEDTLPVGAALSGTAVDASVTSGAATLTDVRSTSGEDQAEANAAAAHQSDTHIEQPPVARPPEGGWWSGGGGEVPPMVWPLPDLPSADAFILLLEAEKMETRP